MKQIILFIIALCAFFPARSEEKNSIQFSETTHNFGYVKEANGPVNYNFEFKNTGKRPVIIYNVRSSCGCTATDYPRNPIKPNEKGKIKLVYNPKSQKGPFDKVVTVNASSGSVYLRIKGNVIPKK